MTTQVTRWWWIRHAPVTVAGGRLYGQNDLPADTSESHVFDGLADALPVGAAWVATPLQRTGQTADAIENAGHAGAPRHIEADFIEQHFGEWQGWTWEEVRAAQGDAFHKFWVAPAHHAPPGGESFADVIARVAPAVDRLTALNAGGDIVSVAHGGSIRAAIAHALELTPDKALAIQIDNCTLTRIDHIEGPGEGGSWRIHGINLRPGLGTL